MRNVQIVFCRYTFIYGQRQLWNKTDPESDGTSPESVVLQTNTGCVGKLDQMHVSC